MFCYDFGVVLAPLVFESSLILISFSGLLRVVELFRVLCFVCGFGVVLALLVLESSLILACFSVCLACCCVSWRVVACCCVFLRVLA